MIISTMSSCAFSQTKMVYEATITFTNGSQTKGLLKRADDTAVEIKVADSIRTIKTENIIKIQVSHIRGAQRAILQGVGIGAVAGAILPHLAFDDELTPGAKSFAMIFTVPVTAFFAGLYAKIIYNIRSGPTFRDINKPQSYRSHKPVLQGYSSDLE